MRLQIGLVLFLFLHSTGVNAQNWQVVPPTDSLQVRSMHIHDDYLFVSYAGLWNGSFFTDAFERLDLNNAYQSQLMYNTNSQSIYSNEIREIVSNPGYVYAIYQNKIVYSADNGLTWTETSTIHDIPIRLLTNGSQQLYVAVDLNLYQSNDFGSSLNFMYHVNFFVNTSVKPLLSNSGLIYSSNQDGLYRNSTKVDDLEFSQMSNIDDTLYGISYYDRLYTSTDYGQNWTLINNSSVDFNHVFSLDYHNGVFYACTEEGLFVSVDKGLSFALVANGLPNYVTDIKFHNSKVYVASLLGVFVSEEAEILTGIAEAQELDNNSVSMIYPNPSSGVFRISNAQADGIVVKDLIGRELSYEKVDKGDFIEITIDPTSNDYLFVHYVDKSGQIRVVKVLIVK